MIGLTGLLVVADVASGALLSTNKEMPALVTRAHRALPWLTGVGASLTTYLALLKAV